MILAALAFVSAAHARPDDGSGMWTYDETDTVTSFDGASGVVRVWYSTTGTNAVPLEDADGTGIPDFVEAVATHSEAVLVNLEDLGFTLP